MPSISEVAWLMEEVFRGGSLRPKNSEFGVHRTPKIQRIFVRGDFEGDEFGFVT